MAKSGHFQGSCYKRAKERKKAQVAQVQAISGSQQYQQGTRPQGKGSQTQSKNGPPRSGINNTKRCYNCNSISHLVRECPYPPTGIYRSCGPCPQAPMMPPMMPNMPQSALNPHSAPFMPYGQQYGFGPAPFYQQGLVPGQHYQYQANGSMLQVPPKW